jgi:hypothetical protein
MNLGLKDKVHVATGRFRLPQPHVPLLWNPGRSVEWSPRFLSVLPVSYALNLLNGSTWPSLSPTGRDSTNRARVFMLSKSQACCAQRAPSIAFFLSINANLLCPSFQG